MDDEIKSANQNMEFIVDDILSFKELTKLQINDIENMNNDNKKHVINALLKMMKAFAELLEEEYSYSKESKSK